VFYPRPEDLSRVAGGLGPTKAGVAGQAAEAARIVADASGRPFDLTTGPLFEPPLLRLGPDDYVLTVRVDHTAFDDWSVDLLRRELSALYTSATAGAPSPLAEPDVSFADVCRRQQSRLDGEAGAAEPASWRQELSGAPLAVQLPIGGDGLYLGTFLILSLLESADGMALIARGVFDRDACRRLLDDLRTFVVHVLADPSCRIPVAPRAEPGDDVVEVRGLRASRPRLEGALGACPGVAPPPCHVHQRRSTPRRLRDP
jgi:hypothetical protein